MKLRTVDFYIEWPLSIEVKDLRKHLVANLKKKGDLIRWSIIGIEKSNMNSDSKKLRIIAVLTN